MQKPGTFISDSLGECSVNMDTLKYVERALNPGWVLVMQNMDHIVHVPSCLNDLQLTDYVRDRLPLSANGVRVWLHESGECAVWCGDYKSN